jgi:hypothetical protein
VTGDRSEKVAADFRGVTRIRRQKAESNEEVQIQRIIRTSSGKDANFSTAIEP